MKATHALFLFHVIISFLCTWRFCCGKSYAFSCGFSFELIIFSPANLKHPGNKSNDAKMRPVPLNWRLRTQWCDRCCLKQPLTWKLKGWFFHTLTMETRCTH